MSRKSVTCYGSATGTPVTEYDSENQAQGGADYVRETYGNDMVPYRCRTCRFWHLSPRESSWNEDGEYSARQNSTRTKHREKAHHKRSRTCYGKATGKPLIEYASKYEANRGAEHARLTHKIDTIQYHCLECNMWHLSPRERQTPTLPQRCSCADKHGEQKQTYATPEAAEARTLIINRERGVNLTVYSCPSSIGWHLTSTPQEWEDKSYPHYISCNNGSEDDVDTYHSNATGGGSAAYYHHGNPSTPNATATPSSARPGYGSNYLNPAGSYAAGYDMSHIGWQLPSSTSNGGGSVFGYQPLAKQFHDIGYRHDPHTRMASIKRQATADPHPYTRRLGKRSKNVSNSALFSREDDFWRQH